MASEGTTDGHSLEHEWVLWEHAGGAKNPKDWKASMKSLCTFSTVENFWRYFNHIPKPADVFYDGDRKKFIGQDNKTVEEYSLFKKGIEPEWGDPRNMTGGEWWVRTHVEPEFLNLYWQNLVLGVIGETIEDGADNGSGMNHINGARVVDKGKKTYPMFKIELWIDTKDPLIKERIRKKLVEVMSDGIPPSRKGLPKFDWKDHTAS